MSEKKKGPGDVGSPGTDLDQAMADAMRAVEARERGSSNGNGAEAEASPTAASGESAKGEGAPKSASDAITESLIKAKKELEQALEQTQTEAKSLRDKWLRAAADLDNYKKRAAKEREDMQKFGNERLLKDFLPIIDDLDRVVTSAKPNDPQTQAFVDGVKLVLKKFLDQLEKHGVTSFSCEGQPFDPNQEEAVAQVHSPHPAGVVVAQLQRGYHLSGRLLRPALVTVSLGPESASS